MDAPLRILRIAQVVDRVGQRRATIYRKLTQDSTFPKQVKLGPKSVGWIEAEVDAWLRAQAAKRPVQANGVSS